MSSTLAFADAPARRATPARRVAVAASLLAVACVLGLVEASLPSLPVVPWLRLGLANIAVVAALLVAGVGTAAVVSIGRVLVVGLATGSLASPTFAMALAGAAASLVVMWSLRAGVRSLSPVGWSAAGSLAHVLAQFAVAGVVLGTGSIIVLAPPSALLSLALGAVVGSLARLAVSRLSLG